MDQAELQKILDDHSLWLSGEGGERANLCGADIYRANLTRANLSQANLCGADIYRANLTRAKLSGANLSQANLCGADLPRAKLRGANLSRANLSRANLYRANLCDTNLYRANLCGANLLGARVSNDWKIRKWVQALHVITTIGGYCYVRTAPDRVKIGCTELPISDWLGEKSQELAEKYELLAWEIEAIRAFVSAEGDFLEPA